MLQEINSNLQYKQKFTDLNAYYGSNYNPYKHLKKGMTEEQSPYSQATCRCIPIQYWLICSVRSRSSACIVVDCKASIS